MSTGDHELWRDRLLTVGSAQGRYFSALALAGLFYYALDAQLVSATGTTELVDLPLVGRKVAIATLQSTAPIVLAFLLLAVLGATRAVSTAARNLGANGGSTIPENLDKSFNLLDAIVYTTSETPQWVGRLLSFAYPAVLTVFWIEGAVFLIEDFARAPGVSFPDIQYPFWQTISTFALRIIGSLLLVASALRLFPFWFRRTHQKSMTRSQAA